MAVSLTSTMQTQSLDPRALLDAPPQDEFALLDCGWTGLRSSRSTPSARLAVAREFLRKRQEVQALPRRLT